MNIIIAAAGTGGHINPGIAIANKVKEIEKDSKVLFIGTGRGLETDLVPRAGYELKTIQAYGIERKITIENIKRMYHTIKSIKEAKKIIKEFDADVIVGTGGYICVPVILAGLKLKVPTLLHESNAFPGVAVKLLSKKVDAVLVGFEEAKERLPKAKRIVVTGSPTKITKKTITKLQKQEMMQKLGLSAGKKTVLVFGGSQGAQSINDSILNIITNHKNKDYQIIWAAGPSQYEIVKEDLKKIKIDIDNIENVKIVPYIYQMEDVMNIVDLVVCRSGAMTTTEIAIVGKPAIFIPFPYATENHQEYNARVLESVGAAKIILDKDLNADILNKYIEQIFSDENNVEKMGNAANKKAIQNVEEKIYKEIKYTIKK